MRTREAEFKILCEIEKSNDLWLKKARALAYFAWGDADDKERP